MRRFFILLLLLIFSLISRSQNSYTCGYSSSKATNNCDFIHKDASIGENNVHEVVNLIVGKVALPKNFILVKCNETNGSPAMAFCSKEGIRYITINNKWISKLNSTSWLTIGVIAHEIGHHLSGHTSNYQNLTLEQRRKQELEADVFSGYIMQSLGASFNQSLEGINYFITSNYNDEYSTHPNKNKRIAAIKEGYYSNKVSLDTNPKPSFENHFNIGVSYLKEDNYDKALSEFTTALTLNPNFSPLWHKLGYIFNKKGNELDAIRCYLKSIELDPNNYNSLHNIGLIYYRKKEYETAIPYLEKSSIYNDALTYEFLAYCYASVKRYEDACITWLSACKLNNKLSCKYYEHRCQTIDDIYLDEITLYLKISDNDKKYGNYRKAFFQYDPLKVGLAKWRFNIKTLKLKNDESISYSAGWVDDLDMYTLESVDDGSTSNYYWFDWNFKNSYDNIEGTIAVKLELFKSDNSFTLKYINKETKKETVMNGFFHRTIKD